MPDIGGEEATEGKVEALVVGAGPVGLAAAEVLAEAGVSVVVADAMPSVGRKFLMAGKSGLNLTKDEDLTAFLTRYGDGNAAFRDAVSQFGPKDVVAWASGLGEDVFTGTTGRVFPNAMKASPLLRRWLARLGERGVEVQTRWRWVGWRDDSFLFETKDGLRSIHADVAVMALGGGSWARLGSAGTWMSVFEREGIACTPFQASNAGLRVHWSDHMNRHFGVPVKGTALKAGDAVTRGEWIVGARGLEGGGVYEVTRAVREGHQLFVDLMPDVSLAVLSARLSAPRGKSSFSNWLRKVGRLSDIQRALLMEWGRPLPNGVELAETIKTLPVPVGGLFPLDEAISTAGGVAWEALEGFMLKSRQGTLVAGEMLDWDAPTGGYLITGCLATGRAAGEQALDYLRLK